MDKTAKPGHKTDSSSLKNLLQQTNEHWTTHRVLTS